MSPNDRAEIETMARFVTERSVHLRLCHLVGRKLPFDTVTVDHAWWDPNGVAPRRFLGPTEAPNPEDLP